MPSNKLIPLLLIVSLTLTSIAAASPRRTINLKGISSLQYTDGPEATKAELTRINPILLSARLSSSEEVFITLNTERRFKDLSASKVQRILQGEARFRSGGHQITAPVSAIIHTLTDTGESELSIMLRTDGARSLHKRIALISLRGTLGAKDFARMRVRAHARKKSHHCATVASTEAQHYHKDSARPLGVMQVDLLLSGDSEFFAAAGSRAVVELTEIASMVDVQYRNDLNVTVNPTIVQSAEAFSARFVYDGNFELDFFPEMRLLHPSMAEDVYVVVTGKTPADSSLNDVAGIAAEIGAVCKSPTTSLATVRRFDSTVASTVYTFSHEVGHLFGGEHDDSLTGNPDIGYIMNSGTGNPSKFVEKFSDYSKSQIGQFIAANSSCLIDVGDLPPPDGTTGEVELAAYIRRSGGRDIPIFSAFTGETPVASYQLLIYRIVGGNYRFAGRARTRANGYAAFKRATRGKYIAFSELDDSLSSNTVTVRR